MPYRIVAKDAAGVIRSQKDLSYAPDTDGVAPYYTPLKQEDISTCDTSNVCKQVSSVYTYNNSYGNLEREDHYGDVAPSNTLDDYTITRTFSPNIAAWIIGLPTNETVYKGINILAQNKFSATDFFYDGAANCNTPSANLTPIKGDLTRVVRWLSGSTLYPETRTAYDAYGNVICIRDPNGNTTSVSYDGSGTFPKVTTNPLGQQTMTQYYGVDGVPTDTGLYSQIKSVTNVNNAITLKRYDIFGRNTQVVSPDGSVATTSYNNLGSVGLQNIQAIKGGLSTWTYFDGLGRTIMEKKTGPTENGVTKIIVVGNYYNNLGQIVETTRPHFEGGPDTGSTVISYDDIGRQKYVYQGAFTTAFCYSLWSVNVIDPNGHMKRETKDAYGRLIQIDEYAGTYAQVCPQSTPGAYTTTKYEYDIGGNSRFVTDAKGNVTEMQYDSLGRKIFMHDPDLGNWSYEYDGNGNLVKQTDAKGKSITFVYDALNRLRTKTSQTNDTFNRSDGTDLGSEWDEYLPNLEIFNTQIRNTDTGNKAARFTKFIGPDQNASVDCKVTLVNNSCAVMARWSDANNFYRVRLDVGAGNIVLLKTVSGTTTQLGVATRTLAYDTYYRIRLVTNGSSISAYFSNEGSPAISVVDTSLTAGNYAGIRSSATAAYSNWFDNFDVTVIFGDSFDKTNNTDLGPDWNEYTTDLEIFSNQIRNTNAASKAARYKKSIGPDQNVSTDCKVTASGNNCAVMARWSDANNYYYAFLDAGLGKIIAYKMVGGAATKLGEALRPLSFNTYYRLRLVVKGASLNVYFGNELTPAISATDTSLVIGSYAGISSYASAAYTTWFDNFNVTTP